MPTEEMQNLINKMYADIFKEKYFSWSGGSYLVPKFKKLPKNYKAKSSGGNI